MTHLTKSIKTILFSLLGLGLTSNVLAQASYNDFTIPAGWEEAKA